MTLSMILLLTGGGTSLAAMHKKAPMSRLRMRNSVRLSPPQSVTAAKANNVCQG